MSINVTGRRITVTDAIRDYALEKIGASCKVMDVPLDAEVVLHIERNRSNPLKAVCEVTLHAKNHIIRVEEQEEDMYAAIDVAAAKVERQLRKFKTKVVDRRVQVMQEAAAERRGPSDELDLDALMADLSAEDEEIVRVKEIEFPPMTEDQALVQIDLLGHDFFAYTDRDTGLVNVLYRRNNGGYGLLKQKA